MPPEFRIALLGQGFMGKAHSNAYVQAPIFSTSRTASFERSSAEEMRRRCRLWRIAGAGRRRPPTGAQ